jgi:NADPH:quinone reductase-like Zn-dependent oxidoreductase
MLDAAYDPDTNRSDPFQAGYEFAGEVVAVGANVTTLEVGATVMGTTPEAFAEYVVCDHRHLLVKPDEVPYDEAAALTTALLTEYGALRAGGFEAGQSIAILGATSAIGLVGVQVARALGASKIIGTTRSAARAGAVRDAGADPVVVTSEDDFATAVQEWTDGEGVDLILDHVGGDLFASAVAAVCRGGTVVNIGRLGGTRATIDLDELSHQLRTLRGVSFGFTDPDQIGDLLLALAPVLMPAVAAGEIRPVISARFPFACAEDAVTYLREESPLGKVVLTR